MDQLHPYALSHPYQTRKFRASRTVAVSLS
ncbi:hypothetical protein CY0110_16502 [Crocosphaera chwakensis CCY0110]|uniref:Uncharacterized protein n=1 Tax=Crocosphaera chwakensis CCY0110 TaxID=391612 RepID=A3IHY2_9CHRO|nr:hypothetical protein CY0110_16502 [Crocosphaera chwakensis CCY0110]